MLAIDRLGRPRRYVGAVDRVSRSQGQRFVLGGVAFELLATDEQARPERALSLAPDTERYCVPADRYPVIADVLCSVAIDDGMFESEGPFGGLELPAGGLEELERGELALRAPRVRATLCRLAPHRYACSARIAGDSRALSAFLQSVTATIVQLEGGAVVHAAGIALEERAVVYVGKSGAGKSTAATLTDGARMFACDRVALIPQPDGGVLAYGLPGGTAAAMPYTDRVVWPLGALFRILRDDPSAPSAHAPRARLLSGADALFTVREAIESVDISAAAEVMRLDAASAIASAAKVGTLHTVLGARIGKLVREQLAASPEERA